MRSGFPQTARAISPVFAKASRLAQCEILLVVGTPAVRPELVARLARAYYHADPQLIDETSVRGEDGPFRYRDPRMGAEWPTRLTAPSWTLPFLTANPHWWIRPRVRLRAPQTLSAWLSGYGLSLAG